MHLDMWEEKLAIITNCVHTTDFQSSTKLITESQNVAKLGLSAIDPWSKMSGKLPSDCLGKITSSYNVNHMQTHSLNISVNSIRF